MANNVKIRTPDVEEILDFKIKSTNPHTQLNVIANEDYDSVLAKIAARSPTLTEKQALDAAVSPSAGNPYVTLSQLTVSLASKLPWKTIGLPGSGADYEGSTDAIFATAFTDVLVTGDTTIGLPTITNIAPNTTNIKVGSNVSGLGIPAGAIVLTVDSATQVTLTLNATSSNVGASYTFYNRWFQVREGAYIFSSTVTIPAEYRVVGSSPSATSISGTVVGPLLSVQNDTYLSYMSVTQLDVTNSTVEVAGDNASLENLIVSSPITGITISCTGFSQLKMFNCVSQVGQTLLTSVRDATLHGCLFDAPTIDALEIVTSNGISLTSSIFKNGVFAVSNSLYIKAVANHFNDGTAINSAVSYAFIPGDVSTVGETITVANHGLVDGTVVSFTTSGTLPAPLALLTSYYIITATTNTFQVSLTLNGAAIDLTTIGLGNHNVLAQAGAILRANTPNTYNNEVDDFANLLAYIGSPSILTVDPPFSNNYGGPPGEDLTARASGLDLLTQWRYEERNFHLMADAEVMTVQWSPSTNMLTSTGPMRLVTTHRESYWLLPTIAAPLNIPSGWALYYILDRTLDSAPIPLSPLVAPLGSIPNNRDNRQVWVLAFCTGTTLWWRGGGGSRFPGTGGQTGTYFVDGSSKSLLDFLGATDYNDSDPNYSNLFAGVQGESLVVRAGKTDTLIKRLFEYSNLGTHLSDGGYITVEPGPGTTYTVSLVGTLYLSFPHVAGRITATNLSWDLDNAVGDLNQLVYFTLNQGGLGGVDIAITASTVVDEGMLPLPDQYPLTTKYFVFARRVGTSVFLWDDSELPIGGRYPEPIGRKIVPTTASVVLPDNTTWDGTDFLWEGLQLAVATGIPLDRNTFVDQTVPSPGLTDLAEGEGLLVTHTWNAGLAQNVTISKVTLPVSTLIPNQNQFIWAQRRSNNIIFLD